MKNLMLHMIQYYSKGDELNSAWLNSASAIR